MYYVVYNTLTGSPVSHAADGGDEWVPLVWEDLTRAVQHCNDLAAEYLKRFGDTPSNRVKFRWTVRTANELEVRRAKRTGIYGPEWESQLAEAHTRARLEGLRHAPDDPGMREQMLHQEAYRKGKESETESEQ